MQRHVSGRQQHARERGGRPKVAEPDGIAVIEAGVSKDVYGAFGDGGFIKKVIDFLSDPANQEKIQAIVKFLVSMAMLFASNDVPGDWSAALTAWNG